MHIRLLVGMSETPDAGDPDLTPTAFHLLSVFLTVILALVLSDIPISVLVALALVILSVTRSFECVTEGGGTVECRLFSKPLSWLVLFAFQLGKTVELSGLGRRVSLYLVKYLGSSLLGLGYSIFLSEFVLGPFIPSNTARGGGIVMPVVMSMTKVLSSTPSTSPATGQFLILCGSHANLLISSFFLTATVANPLIASTATATWGHAAIDFDFVSWFLGAIVPGGIVVVILPIFFKWVTKAKYNPADVVGQIDAQLDALGPLTLAEKQLGFVLVGCLLLWMTGSSTGIPETWVAMTGLVVLLLLGTVSWDEVVSNSKAWDAFFWLSGMVLMAEQVSSLGISRFIGQHCARMLATAEVSPVSASLLLGLLYFFSMYIFSSITAHIVAFVGPFMEAAKVLGCPPYLVTAILAYFSATSACLTNFSSGPPVIYFGQGYITQARWFVIGLAVAGISISVFFTVGLAWWKVLGFF
ncbi:Sodium/sulfate symporter [Blyttiomyces helicus]|uniref:Sodium/sulfate symporter n=1 Tax=Blyttiomyces helicus TaxID=388810 RepID=A0A4P9WJS2_9FUNG|nr:Sodium/sulfate symporter [Blyttiomyces helicus]|eukprot:RKO91390.1 Sodium/sulfate symporter [Blyttiomyces helicus]